MRKIFWVLIFIVTACTHTYADQLQDVQLKGLASLIEDPLYQLEIGQTKKLLLSHLNQNKGTLGIVLIDEFDTQEVPTLSLWKEGYKKDDKNLVISKISIRHPKSKREIGKLILYNAVDALGIMLTQNEREYLKQKKKISMCIEPAWGLFQKNKTHEETGFASDYIKLFSSKIDTPIVMIETISWEDTLKKIKDRECDVLPLAAKTAKRELYMDFTSPFIEAPVVIATRIGISFIENINQIHTKRLGVVKGHALFSLLKDKYPHINLIPVDSVSSGLKKVQKGELFGCLHNSILLNNEIQKNYNGILTISGKFQEVLKLNIATRNDEKLLHSIFEKAVSSIDEKIKQELIAKWTIANYTIRPDYTYIWQILLFSILIVLLFAYWNIRLKNEIKKRHIAEIKLKELNNTLEIRVVDAVNETHNKELLLQQQSRLAQMGEMINMIAHQWRQPLSATSGATMAIKTKIRLKKFDLEKPNEREMFEIYLTEKLEDIQKYIKVMTETINDFRNFFKKDRKQIYVNINDPVEKALSIIMPHLKEQNIVIVKQLESMKNIDLYPNEVMQVILNLLKNADDAFSENATEKKIVIHTYDCEQAVKIEIYDNAGGVSMEIAEKIFDPYFSTKLDKNGSGLGLYMSKMIIEDHHHGTLKLSNKEDGACFTLTFKVNNIEEST